MSKGSLEQGVVKESLANGLTVLLKEDHSAPIAAVNVWFGVGSVNESEEMNGLAHFQEHMVFKGTRKYGVGEIANLVKAAGGNLNAGTSYSYTMYYIVLPSRSFRTALEIQADAMMHSTFDPEEFRKERLVVIDEARMYDDRPESYTFYRTMELGFQKHNYRRPIAGYQPIVEKITRDQLLEFYNNYYRPSNAVLVVVGDIDVESALGRIEQVYGTWKPGEVAMGESPVEPPQDGFRYQGFQGTIDHAYVGAGFHVPNILHEDYPALEMLSELLGSGKSSRLHRRVLEEKQLVTSVSASLLAEKWPGYFLFMASMTPAKWQAARDAVLAEIERLKHEPVEDGELEKARRQLERSLYSELETMEGQASNLGYYELLGDYRLADQHREAMRKVTPDQIAMVARKYFHPHNLSLVSYLPAGNGGIPDTSGVEAAVGEYLSDAGGVTDMGTDSAKDRVKSGTAGKRATRGKPAASDTAVTKFELENGIRVLLKRRSTVPMVSLFTAFEGGSKTEPPGRSGVATLCHGALTKGTKSFSTEEIVTRIEGLGGRINSYANFDTSGVYINVLSRKLDDAVPVYREVMREPLFDADRVAQERERLLEEIAERRDNPVQFAMDQLFGKAFGDHAYAYPFVGKPDELSRLDESACAGWYGVTLDPQRMVVAFVGDVEEEKALEVAQKLYGDLPAGKPAPSVKNAPALPVEPGTHTLSRKGLKQGVALVGYLAPAMMTDDALHLKVLNGVLTGLGGRLFVELRDKRSLGYMTGSAFSPYLERSLFFGYANPNADGVDEAIQVIQDQLARVAREAVTPEELERSKEWLIGSQVMQLQRNFSQASAYGTYEALGFGFGVVDEMPDRLQGTDAEGIVDVAARVFDPQKAVVVRLMPE